MNTISSYELVKRLNIPEYELVNLINRRIRELLHGSKPLVEDKDCSFLETAVLELVSGKIKPQK